MNLKAFFERFFGIGGGSFTEDTGSAKIVSYADAIAGLPVSKAAEDSVPCRELKRSENGKV